MYLKEKINFKRIILASIIGETTILLFFININKVSLIIFKFLISILIVRVAFKNKNISNMFVFYIISIMLGGVIYFIKNNFKFDLIFIYIIGVFTLYKIFRYIKYENKNLALKHNLKIIFKSHEYNLYGFVDTGNKVFDPITKKNIIIVSKELIKCDKNILVPCNTINGSGIIKCIKPDRVYIDGKCFNNLLIGESMYYNDFAILPSSIEIGG